MSREQQMVRAAQERHGRWAEGYLRVHDLVQRGELHPIQGYLALMMLRQSFGPLQQQRGGRRWPKYTEQQIGGNVTGSGGMGIGGMGLSAAGLSLVGDPGDYATAPEIEVSVAIPSNVGTVWNIASGDSTALQNALTNAVMGDIIQLAAGGTWVGNFTYPSRAWSEGQFILVRPSNYAALAAAWPLQANGMPSDIARSSTSTNPRMTVSRATALGLPKLMGASNNNITTIRQLPNSRGLYFWGIDAKDNPAFAGETFQIIGPDTNDFVGITHMDQMPSHFVWNQCLARSRTNGENRKAAALNLNHHAFVNSYAESHHISNENAALWTAWGRGPLRWENNAVVGAAITAFIGGVHFSAAGAPWHVDLFPRDCTVMYNYFHTPNEWLEGHPSYSLPIVERKKNLFETKLGGRIRFEANVMSGSTAGQQNGQGLTLKVLNEGYSGGYTIPGPMTWSELHDVIVRYNLQKNTGSGFDIAANQQTSNHPTLKTHEATQANRILMEHNIFLVADTSEGVTGSRGELGIWQAFLASDAVRGKKIASWMFRHNTFITRSTQTYNIGIYLGGKWDTGWPKFHNNIFSRVNFRHFSADSIASTAQALSIYMPGVEFNRNIFGKLSSGDNDFSNAFGNFESNNVYLGGDAAIGVDPFTGQLSGGSPAKAGGAYQASDGSDNGADYATVMAKVAGLEFWQ
jgi:hypothetical protein